MYTGCKIVKTRQTQTVLILKEIVVVRSVPKVCEAQKTSTYGPGYFDSFT